MQVAAVVVILLAIVLNRVIPLLYPCQPSTQLRNVNLFNEHANRPTQISYHGSWGCYKKTCQVNASLLWGAFMGY